MLNGILDPSQNHFVSAQAKRGCQLPEPIPIASTGLTAESAVRKIRYRLGIDAAPSPRVGCARQASIRDRGGRRSQDGNPMRNLLNRIWSEQGQDIAEYAVMLAVILVLVVGTIRLVGSNANNAFSSAASSIQ
jgi:Flp pilus assembly pilin Flp